MMRVYVADVPDAVTRLDVAGDEAHHLARVVRVRVGDDVSVFDGRGRVWSARVDAVGRQTVGLRLDGEVTPVPEPPVAVTLGIGVLKGDRMDAVVRDATVMGVSTIVPLVTDHVTVSPRAWRDTRGRSRWERVAIAAAKQCGRAVLPTIAPVTGLGDVAEMATVTSEDGGHLLTLVCVEPSVVPVAAPATAGMTDWRSLPRPAAALLLVGPEGGWSAAELTVITGTHAHVVSLGPRILRADAVPVVAMTMLWSAWGWV